jgi:hypothetical protein
MEKRENGRHCAQCAKIVVDFTKMTSTDILDYLASSKNACGRFSKNQLIDINYFLKIKNAPATPKWKKSIATAIFLLTGLLNKVNAQTKTPHTTHLLLRHQPRVFYHKRKKLKQTVPDFNTTQRNNTELIAYRADVANSQSSLKELQNEHVRNINLNEPVELTGILGGVVSGIEITPQSRVLMFYQYVPWPINRLFK